MIILGCVFYGLWEIWKERCRCNPHRLISRIYHYLYGLNLQIVPKRAATRWDTNILENMGLPIRHVKKKRGRWVCWTPPPQGMMKVNVDGSCKGTKGACGGVIRSSSGEFLHGFCTQLAHSDEVQSELDAILEGILMCKRLHIDGFVVETDCSEAYQMIMDSNKGQWKYSNTSEDQESFGRRTTYSQSAARRKSAC